MVCGDYHWMFALPSWAVLRCPIRSGYVSHLDAAITVNTYITDRQDIIESSFKHPFSPIFSTVYISFSI